MSGVRRSLVGVAVGGIVIVLLAAGFGWGRYHAFLEAPLDVSGPEVQFRVQPGDTVGAVIGDLERRGVTRDDWRWRLLLRLEPVTIQAGEYALEPGATPRSLLDLMARGEVIQYRFTLVEGWNWRQLRAALQADERLRVDPARLDETTVMAEIGSDETHPEGWFLPETWAYTAADDAIGVLRRAHRAMRAVLEQAWEDRDPALPLDDPYDLLILASIVQKESAVAAEYAEIAGVFNRRLQQNWRLETDPTVIYGLGEAYDGDIRTRDLRTDTPYNTYTRRGLPPTPIAMAGEAVLRATARPAEGTAMFFVADGRGGHVFSETLEQHNRAVQDLIQRQRARRARADAQVEAQAEAEAKDETGVDAAAAGEGAP